MCDSPSLESHRGDPKDRALPTPVAKPRVCAALLAFRLANALLVVTQFDPDEFWQGPEVAHALVYGYGEVTWEWSYGMRGHAHVLPFVLLLHTLRALRCDSAALVAHAPRLLQAALSAAGDLALSRFAAVYFEDEAIGRDVLLLSASSWFVWYCAVRTYSSSMEASVLCVLLALMASPGRLTLGQSRLHACAVGSLAALMFQIRPTALLFLPALFGAALHLPRDRLRVAACAIFALGTTLLGVALDRVFYGVWVLPWLNFFRFNLLTDGASYYGTHPWHWYASHGLPAVLATHLPLVVLGCTKCKGQVAPLIAAICALVGLSGSRHKELRFLMPVVPPLLVYGAVGLRSIPRRRRRACLLILFSLNGLGALYLSRWHQQAPIAALAALRAEAASGRLRHIDLLTRCHQTPAFAQLHSPARLTMLHCPPPGIVHLQPLEQQSCGNFPYKASFASYTSKSSCVNECDCFFENFPEAVKHRLRRASKRPSHIILFEDDYLQTRLLFNRLGYSIIGMYFHELRPSCLESTLPWALRTYHLLLLRRDSHK
ncbi:hypothetical protein AB1Y20_007555 [Prymnesium parvum]|uniref:Mannosyltransferase n=1 Tax=Prymnesium parvum TaxID=97485 RepID=A0AB34IXU1_PRYPA